MREIPLIELQQNVNKKIAKIMGEDYEPLIELQQNVNEKDEEEEKN